MVKRYFYLIRHGARGPSQSCFGFWPEGHLVRQWPADEVDRLTAAGREQMRQLGQLLRKRHEDAVQAGNVEWFSSVSERARRSGELLVGEMAPSVAAAGPQPPPMPPDEIFRPFNTNESYRNAVAQLQTEGADGGFDALVAEHGTDADAVWTAAGLPADATAHQRLFFQPYIAEVVACEHAHPRVSALTECLSAKCRDATQSLARAVWAHRFLHVGAQFRLGNPLLSFIMDWLTTAQDITADSVAICSAHDYTILCLLAASQLPFSYEQTLEFGATLRFDLDNDHLVNISLFANPFEARESRANTLTEPSQTWQTSIDALKASL